MIKLQSSFVIRQQPDFPARLRYCLEHPVHDTIDIRPRLLKNAWSSNQCVHRRFKRVRSDNSPSRVANNAADVDEESGVIWNGQACHMIAAVDADEVNDCPLQPFMERRQIASSLLRCARRFLKRSS